MTTVFGSLVSTSTFLGINFDDFFESTIYLILVISFDPCIPQIFAKILQVEIIKFMCY